MASVSTELPRILVGIIRIESDIREVHGVAACQGPRYDRLAAGSKRNLVELLRQFRGHAVAGGRIIDAVARPPDVRTVALAQPIGRLDDRIEHRLKIEFRAADNLENFGGSCLLFKCDTEIRGARLNRLKKPRVL